MLIAVAVPAYSGFSLQLAGALAAAAPTTRYDATPLPASANPPQLSATCPLPGAAVTVPLLGAVASSVMLAVGLVVVVVLPAASRRTTVTVFLPSPAASVHALLAAKASKLVHVVVFDTHIRATPLASLPAIASVTWTVLVVAAP